MKMQLSLAAVVILSGHGMMSAFANNVVDNVVPTFDLNDLVTGQRLTELEAILTTSGLLAVKPNSSTRRQAALDGLCHCGSSIPEVERVTLNDGTLRTTLAAVTAGPSPVALSRVVNQYCGSEVMEAFEALRDDVAVVTNAFVTALDRLLLDHQDRPLLRNSNQGEYRSIAEIQARANHLEHFHIYSKPGQGKDSIKQDNELFEEETRTLEWHTDAGLFLAFVPARTCVTDSDSIEQPDDSFWWASPDGDTINAEFPQDSVIIMLGAGAEHWLDTAPLSLKATRHAVRMAPGQVRAWYGMMTLVPDIAIVREHPEETFGAMKKRAAFNILPLWPSRENEMKETEKQLVSLDGGLYQPQDFGKTSNRRRLHEGHAKAAVACNNVTNFYCWMSCMTIPNVTLKDQLMLNGYSLYCVDPYVVSSNQSALAVDACDDSLHNSNCTGQWLRTLANISGYDFQQNNITKNSTGSNNTLKTSSGTPSNEQFYWKSVSLLFLVNLVVMF